MTEKKTSIRPETELAKKMRAHLHDVRKKLGAVDYYLDQIKKPLVKESAFGDAFARARLDGKETFDYKGKSYSSRKAGENDEQWKSAIKPKVAPIPAARLNRDKMTTRVAARPDAPTGSLPGKKFVSRVAARPDAPTGSLPASDQQRAYNDRLKDAADSERNMVNRPRSAYSDSAQVAANTLAARMRAKIEAGKRMDAAKKVDVVKNMGGLQKTDWKLQNALDAKAKSMAASKTSSSSIKVGIKEENDELKYITDGKRHLVCHPYTVENLHAMAADLGIKKHWFHAGDKPHYDVPVKMKAEVEARCHAIVSSSKIVKIIRGEGL